MVIQSFKLTDARDVQDLAAVVPAGAVVFIDTLNRAAPGADDNASKDMGEILEAAKVLQTKTGGWWFWCTTRARTPSLACVGKVAYLLRWMPP